MRILELPDPLFDSLMNAADASHLTPIDWIAARLSSAPNRRSLTKEEMTEENRHLMAFAGIAHSGDPDFGNNERIDADLYS